MTNQDIFFLGSWALSLTVGLIGIIVSLIGKYKEAFKFWAGFTAISITPFGAGIPLICLTVGLVCLIVGGGEKLIDNITKNWNDSI